MVLQRTTSKEFIDELKNGAGVSRMAALELYNELRNIGSRRVSNTSYQPAREIIDALSNPESDRRALQFILKNEPQTTISTHTSRLQLAILDLAGFPKSLQKLMKTKLKDPSYDLGPEFTRLADAGQRQRAEYEELVKKTSDSTKFDQGPWEIRIYDGEPATSIYTEGGSSPKILKKGSKTI